MNFKKIGTSLQIAFQKNKQYFKSDTLAGITVALALIPEAIAFAFVAGVTPLLSLQTAVIVAFFSAIFTGRPGMISASTAAIAVVLAPLVAEHGLEYLFATVVLMGVFQVIAGIFKLGKYTTIIPHSVVLGFLNGLALVIFFSQFEQFMTHETVIIDGVKTHQATWLPFVDILIMLLFVGITMGIIHFFPKITKAIPSSLVAIAVVTIFAVLLQHYGIYHLASVQDFARAELVGKFPLFHFPEVFYTWSSFSEIWEILRIIFPYAFVASLVGLTEAALTLRVIDDMTNTKGKMDKEFSAQGAGNLVAGFFGGMGGCAMIGQSIINIRSGAQTRLSGIVAAISLLLFLLYAGPLVNAIPLASLVGLMFMVVVATFKWESLKYGGKIPKQDMFIIGAVTIITILLDLATAVIAGVLLATVMFAWEKGNTIESKVRINKKGHKIYTINGFIFFGSALNFKNLFEVAEDPKTVVLDLKHTKVMDHSAIEAIDSLSEKYTKAGKKLIITRPSNNCREMLKNAQHITSIKIDENYNPTEQ